MSDVTVSDRIRLTSGGILIDGIYRSPIKEYFSYYPFECALTTFYVLEELWDKARKLPSRHPYRKKLGWVREAYVRSLARAFRDCLALMCFGEARHTEEITTDDSGWWHNPLWGMTRGEAYWCTARDYDLEKSLDVMKKLFMREGWPAGYGGLSWAHIVDWVKKYEELSPIIYCDSVFGITHNGGVAFNKQESGIAAEHYIHVDKILSAEYLLNYRRCKSFLKMDDELLRYIEEINDLLLFDNRVYGVLLEARRWKLIDLPVVCDRVPVVFPFRRCIAEFKRVEWEGTEVFWYEYIDESDIEVVIDSYPPKSVEVRFTTEAHFHRVDDYHLEVDIRGRIIELFNKFFFYRFPRCEWVEGQLSLIAKPNGFNVRIQWFDGYEDVRMDVYGGNGKERLVDTLMEVRYGNVS